VSEQLDKGQGVGDPGSARGETEDFRARVGGKLGTRRIRTVVESVECEVTRVQIVHVRDG
jgi:hypothetical protein